MNRIIKFRAWDGNNMYYSNEEQTVWMGGMEVSVNTNKGKIIRDFIGMQFTGLLDKNGKEIYEGDIVRVWQWEFDENNVEQVGREISNNQKVEWSNDFYGWAITDKTDTSDPMAHYAQFEYIGNIFENKNLLTNIFT